MAVVIVVVVLVLVGAAVAFLMRQRSRSSNLAGRGPNEILASPPSSFPSTPPGPLTPSITAVPPGTALPAAPTPEGLVAVPGEATPDVADDDAAILERFRAPEIKTDSRPTRTTPVVAPRYPLEPEPVVAEVEPEPEPVLAETVPEAEPEPEPVVAETVPEAEPEPEPVVAEAEPAPEPAASGLQLVEDDDVIDLDADSVVSEEERAWQQVVLEPEPDSVDHVLQALINRARFKQVGVEEVATELVERADLRGEQVSDVLAELVGRADDQAIGPDRASELVLFNDAVPSRPGQLTDFARLNPADKKRIIIRVLCLLVARSEDQQLPPRASGESPTASWPLARASWPVGLGDEDGDVSLPNRLAKSG